MRSIKLAVYKMNTRGAVQTHVALQTGQLVVSTSGTALDTLHPARQVRLKPVQCSITEGDLGAMSVRFRGCGRRYKYFQAQLSQ